MDRSVLSSFPLANTETNSFSSTSILPISSLSPHLSKPCSLPSPLAHPLPTARGSLAGEEPLTGALGPTTPTYFTP